ncbi:response regulator transcription factor [Legionella worsleiensis]|uniref:LuxR family transcriptional regulator n=1 Tax=Legionella worsleiensis TaxID=45076 RepID=A0A0W1AA77_9GAMM|nr:helix-turn-helix transcriptional regulator [Legionella worsleiensis]KTD77987.1 LuxR family transcriptional regulator [Legionella worsleiensis]STY31541.1 LuxR family transcriptional regulator [Legionella worsleiensis]
MTALSDLYRKVTSVPEHGLMLRSVAPLYSCFGVNNFYYVRVTSSGHYSGLSSHDSWHEYFCANIATIGKSPFLKHPDLVKPGINLLKNTDDPLLKKTLHTAWHEYGINFTLNIMKKIPEGIEAFGWGTDFNDPRAEERQLNDLPLLNQFIHYFYEHNQKLIRLAHEYQVDVSSFLDTELHDTYKVAVKNKKKLLEHLGFSAVLSLTSRELETLNYLAHGFSAKYIAQQLRLSPRTVEDHVGTIKAKLNCQTRLELIRRTQEIASILFVIDDVITS